jgi:isoleucyl-tRNA synthetase
VDETTIQKDLEERMDYAQRISSLVLSLRKKENIRVRQPLKRVLLPVRGPQFKEQVKKVEDLILQEVNVKAIEYVEDASDVIKKSAKPNFKRLGKRMGADMKAANAKIQEFTDADIQEIEDKGEFTLEINGNTYDLTLEDLEIRSEDIPGWQVASDGKITVALDVQIDDELEAEGMARELVNRIQNLRKDNDFKVTDRIDIYLEKHQAVEKAVSSFGDYIQKETLADTLQWMDDNENGEQVDLVDDIEINMKVKRK